MYTGIFKTIDIKKFLRFHLSRFCVFNFFILPNVVKVNCKYLQIQQEVPSEENGREILLGLV